MDLVGKKIEIKGINDGVFWKHKGRIVKICENSIWVLHDNGRLNCFSEKENMCGFVVLNEDDEVKND